MISRVAAATVAVAMVILVASGCQPEPAPSPSAAAFATEAEAFAAAEETYRAYVDALNQVDLSDPETFEAVYAWTTGELNSSDRKNFSAWHADGYSKSGDARVGSVVGSRVRSVGGPAPEVDLDACYDVSDVTVVDSAGISVISPDRPDVQKLKISLVAADTPTQLALQSIAGSESDLSC
jgi:hypothetical protein